MRKIREVFRLKFECELSNRKIAKSCLIARSTVAEYLFRFKQAALSWPLSRGMDDAQLEQLLYPAPLPDFDYIHTELRKKGVTLSLLWQEYKEHEALGYQYSQFCHRYRRWAAKIDPVMRQEHRAGEKMFVDYTGHTVSVHDPHTNTLRTAQVFVAVMGASNYTYAEATWTQTLPDWIGSQCAREGTMSKRCKSSSGLSLSGPVAKRNCVAVRRGGEQQEVNDQSVG